MEKIRLIIDGHEIEALPGQSVLEAALADAKVQKFTDGMEIFKVILVKNKLINLIVRPKK